MESEQADDHDPELPSSVIAPSKPRLLSILGPGLITGASDDDPSGIATYSQAGAQFGYALSWTMLYTYPLMVAVQMISARIGRTTGHGVAGVLRLHYPNWLLQIIVLMLLVANIINLGADLGAMADAARLLLPVPAWLFLLFFAAVCVFMQVFLQYTRYVSVLKWLTLALFAYFIALAASHVDWRQSLRGLVVPRLSLNKDALTMIVAIFGTTISPYLFFWQSAEEVEDIAAFPRRHDLFDAPEQGKSALHRIEIDTLVGMGFSNLVALAIMMTTAATLNVHGITNMETSAQAAEALRPLAGNFAAAVFTIGIVGVGLLSVPVLAGSAAYAIGEARSWPVGFNRRWQEAKAFYGTVSLATLVGLIMNFSAIDPVRALIWSAVVNGVIAVPIMAVMMKMAARPDIMGKFVIEGALQRLGWIATGIMALAAVAMIASSI